MCPKENSELSANSLQSPDDLEAAYREKRGKGYQGYVANLTETCDPENPLQLITKLQVAPNNVDDSQLLAKALLTPAERAAFLSEYFYHSGWSELLPTPTPLPTVTLTPMSLPKPFITLPPTSIP